MGAPSRDLTWDAYDRERRQKQRPPKADHFPAIVTLGTKPDGTLDVRVFHSCEEADAAGLPWVGR